MQRDSTNSASRRFGPSRIEVQSDKVEIRGRAVRTKRLARMRFACARAGKRESFLHRIGTRQARGGRLGACEGASGKEIWGERRNGIEYSKRNRAGRN